MVAGECRACGLELAALERGGRFAGLLTIALAALLITAALALESLVQLPLWLIVALWVPVTVASVLFALRLAKTASVWRHYQRQFENEERR